MRLNFRAPCPVSKTLQLAAHSALGLGVRLLADKTLGVGGRVRLAAVAAAFFGCMSKSRVEYRVMAMELTVEVGRANFRWERDSFMIMVGSRIPNKQQRSYAGSRSCAGVV